MGIFRRRIPRREVVVHCSSFLQGREHGGFAGSIDTTAANLCTRIVGWVSWDLRESERGKTEGSRDKIEKSVPVDGTIWAA